MIVILPPNQGVTAAERTDSKAIVLRACRAMLRPIVRMLLKSGVVHRDLLHLTREVYVDVARSEFGLRGRPTSISRTALLTGLARKEVRRIMDVIEGGENANHDKNSSQDRITRVLSGWFQDEDYVTKDGQPLAIPTEGPAPSFADLKSRYGGDVPASAILRELINAGTVEKDNDGNVRPRTRYYMPNPADSEHLLRAGSVIEDIGTTVVRNLYRGDDGLTWLERRATNTCLPQNMVAEFREMVAVEGQQFLEKIDAWMSSHEDTSGEQETARVGLGMYIIKNESNEEEGQ